MKKILLKAVFEKIKYGGFTVVYWDGETIQYGNSHSKFTIVFKKNPPFAASIDDPILTFGEYYMDDIVDFEGSLEEMIFSPFGWIESSLILVDILIADLFVCGLCT